MDRLLDNDTREARVTLDPKQSRTFLEFIYPDQLLFSNAAGESSGQQAHSMDEILAIFRKKGWYGSMKSGTSTIAQPGVWLSPSGCPSLATKSIKNRELQLARFFNNVLEVVGEFCNTTFFCWDARSANSPLDGSRARRKPDIICCFEAPDIHSLHWGQVATFCEVKSRLDGKRQRQSFTEIAGKASCIFGVQDGRHLVPCIRFLGSTISLTIFDRGGSVTTHAFDINHSPEDFLRILVGVSLTNYSALGFDMSIEWDGREGETDNNEEIGPSGKDSVQDSEVSVDGSDSEQDLDDKDYEESESDDEDDEECKFSGQSKSSVNERRRKWMKITDKDGRTCTIWLKKILSISNSLLGRGTTVWEGIMGSTTTGKDPDDAVVVKDSWIDPLRKYTEGMILRLECHGVEGVPRLLAERQVKLKTHWRDMPVAEANHSTHFIRSILPNIRSPNDFHLRVLSRLVTRPVGMLITDFSSLGELLVAFLDCIIAHKDAVERAKVLHRDISLVNLLFAITNPGDRTGHEIYIRRYLEGQPQLDLCRRINGLGRRGVLADWGYAVPVPDLIAYESSANSVPSPSETRLPTSPIKLDIPGIKTPVDLVPAGLVDGSDKTKVTFCQASQLTGKHEIVLQMGTDNPEEDPRSTIDACPLYHTGTWSWMAAELVMAGPNQPVLHTSQHDLESFFYVLVGICVLYSEPEKQKSDEELGKCYDALFNTFTPSVLKTITIGSNLTWFPGVVEHISPYFQPVIPLLGELRREIIMPMSVDPERRFHRTSSFDHSTIIRHVIRALSTLGPEAWGDTATQGLDVSEASETRSNGNQASNPLPPSFLDPPIPLRHRVTCSNSGAPSGHGVGLLPITTRSEDPANVGRGHDLASFPSSKETGKHANTRSFLPPPLVPVHESLLASGRQISCSDSHLVLAKRPRDGDSDECVHGNRKRTRSSFQRSSELRSSTTIQDSTAAKDEMPLRRSQRKKPNSKF